MRQSIGGRSSENTIVENIESRYNFGSIDLWAIRYPIAFGTPATGPKMSFVGFVGLSVAGFVSLLVYVKLSKIVPRLYELIVLNSTSNLSRNSPKSRQDWFEMHTTIMDKRVVIGPKAIHKFV